MLLDLVQKVMQVLWSLI